MSTLTHLHLVPSSSISFDFIEPKLGNYTVTTPKIVQLIEINSKKKSEPNICLNNLL